MALYGQVLTGQSKREHVTFPARSDDQSRSLGSLGRVKGPVINDSRVVFVRNKQSSIDIQPNLQHQYLCSANSGSKQTTLVMMNKCNQTQRTTHNLKL